MAEQDRPMVRTSPAVTHLVTSKLAEVIESVADRVRVEHKQTDRELLITLRVPTQDIKRDRLDKALGILSDSLL